MDKAKHFLTKLMAGDPHHKKHHKPAMGGVGSILLRALRSVAAFFRQNWKGTLIILAVTLWFFWPIVTRIDSYSEGGDAMFNAWTLSRNHHCLTGDRCADYTDGNIYFPHKDTMLYSETQLSAGLLTLPLHWINDNPIFAYNIWTIASVFLGGWCMYLLAKYLSRGNEWIAILAGLVFAFAPFKMAAIFHLQNLSIFYLPLAVLLLFRYIDTRNKWYLPALFAVLSLQFYASWYNMVFTGAALTVVLVGLLLFRIAKLKQVLMVVGVMALAVLSILPLAIEYMRFSRETGANFSIKDQTLYSSSAVDYFLPHNGTMLGQVIDRLNPAAHRNSYNLDSYSYHGLVLYILAGALLVITFLRRKDKGEGKAHWGMALTFGGVGLLGLILSLGPLLKIKGSYTYATMANGIEVALPLPYLLIDRFVPQLTFIRAVGRWSVLFLFALCCMLAYLAYYVSKRKWYKKRALAISLAITALVIFELMPIHQVHMSKNEYSYNLKPPAVYEFVKARPEIDNIIVLRGDEDYPKAPIPIARAEDVLWSGYHNRNIYNGYSGYTPPNYFIDYGDYKDFEPDDIAKMKNVGLQYVIVDKMLSNNRPHLADNIKKYVGNKLYEDERYSLHKL